MAELGGYLSPTFSGFCRLFVVQALRSTPDPKISGIFKVKGWVFRNVQLCGTVMNVTEREKLVSVLLDDGTGVIKCVIWKQQRFEQNQLAQNRCNLESKLKKLIRMDPEVLECGKSYIVRGRLQVYNGSLEMNAFSYCKLESCVDEIEMVCSNEVIHKFYSASSQISHDDVLEVPVLEITRLLRSKDSVVSMSTFTLRDLYFNDEIVTILRQHSIAKAQMNALLQSSISSLLDTGEAFIDGSENGETNYCLVREGSALHSDILKIIRNEKNGAQSNDILKLMTTKTFYKKLNLKVVKRVLDDLESQSQIYEVKKSVYSVL